MRNPLKKNRFTVRPFINGIGFIVWDTKYQRTYRAFQRETDAKLCRDIVNKQTQTLQKT